MKNFTLFTVLFLTLFLSCKEKSKTTQDIETTKQPVVYVSNYPLYYFAERIANSYIDLHFPASNTVDPAFWEPVTDTIVAMQNADLILLNGASYEKWMLNVSLPNSITINTSKTFETSYLNNGENFTHSHGGEGAHTHEEIAFTTWLDFSLAIQQASAIKDALVKLIPEQKQLFDQNYNALVADLQNLDIELKNITKDASDVVVAFSHPIYQYLQNAYAIKGTSFHWEPNKTFSHDNQHDLEHLLEKQPVKFIIWEAEPLDETKEYLAKKGIQTIIFSTLTGKPEQGDFLEVMQQNIKNLQQIYSVKLP
jgi:zinc transport system substrate-binding protein